MSAAGRSIVECDFQEASTLSLDRMAEAVELQNLKQDGGNSCICYY